MLREGYPISRWSRPAAVVKPSGSTGLAAVEPAVAENWELGQIIDERSRAGFGRSAKRLRTDTAGHLVTGKAERMLQQSGRPPEPSGPALPRGDAGTNVRLHRIARR
jgi:hypothetical protein